MISVIMPIHKPNAQLPDLRRRICSEKNAELILVIQNGLKINKSEYNNEHLLYSNQKGRGNNFAIGLDSAKNDIVLFNHCDTMLPANWYKLVDDAMKNKEIAGGGFHLHFDRSSFALRSLVWLSDCLFHLTGEMWGDRSMFTKTALIKSQREVIDVPIMEDVRLSRFLRKKGKLKMLPEYVVTSCDTFLSRGVVKHTLRILNCRLSYIFEKDLQKIYEHYYS